ncbi:hypothetical protein GEMRC1_007381 [Eukaryota sp. GEM-RC1]
MIMLLLLLCFSFQLHGFNLIPINSKSDLPFPIPTGNYFCCSTSFSTWNHPRTFPLTHQSKGIEFSSSLSLSHHKFIAQSFSNRFDLPLSHPFVHHFSNPITNSTHSYVEADIFPLSFLANVLSLLNDSSASLIRSSSVSEFLQVSLCVNSSRYFGSVLLAHSNPKITHNQRTKSFHQNSLLQVYKFTRPHSLLISIYNHLPSSITVQVFESVPTELAIVCANIKCSNCVNTSCDRSVFVTTVSIVKESVLIIEIPVYHVPKIMEETSPNYRKGIYIPGTFVYSSKGNEIGRSNVSVYRTTILDESMLYNVPIVTLCLLASVFGIILKSLKGTKSRSSNKS